MTQRPDQVWLSKDAYDRLRSELEDLKGPQRQKIADRLAQAREEGNLVESAEYQLAVEEQDQLEARIRHVEEALTSAQVGETPPNDGMVEPGMKVTVRFVDFDETETFLFGARELESHNITVYSPRSALGAAIDGKQRGDTVSYAAPNGKELRVEIVEAIPFEG